MVVTLTGKLMCFMLLHLANVLLPILVTPLAIVTEVSPVHWLNAPLPTLVTLLGMTIDVSPVHPLNASAPIIFIHWGINIFFILVSISNPEGMTSIKSGIFISVIPVPLKALLPMPNVPTLAGMSILVTLLWFSKALLSMPATIYFSG